MFLSRLALESNLDASRDPQQSILEKQPETFE